MMHLRSEGKPIQQGFNFYPLSDKGSIGFVYRKDNKATMFRYSKYLKKFVCQKLNIT
jgi:hypothetical protein